MLWISSALFTIGIWHSEFELYKNAYKNERRHSEFERDHAIKQWEFAASFRNIV